MPLKETEEILQMNLIEMVKNPNWHSLDKCFHFCNEGRKAFLATLFLKTLGEFSILIIRSKNNSSTEEYSVPANIISLKSLVSDTKRELIEL